MNYEEFKKSVDLYLDGELDAASALKFQEAVEADPRCRELLEREESLRLRVREELSKEAAPDILWARIRRDLQREDLRHRVASVRGWRAAAAVLLAIVIGGAVYFQYDRRDLSRLVESSIRTHQLFARAGESVEFPAVNERTLLPLIQKRVDFPLALPALVHNDIQMIGGRIGLVAERKSALTLYRKGDNPLSLFTLESRSVRLPRWGGKEINGRLVYFRDSGDFRVAVWKDGECAYSLVAPLREEDLTRYLAASFREIVRPQGS